MPRRAAGARLYQRPKGKGAGYWIIRDGGRSLSTGTRDRRQAEQKLAEYIAQKNRPTAGPRSTDQVTVSEVLDIYAMEHAPHVVDRKRIATSIRMIVPILGKLPLSMLTREVCRRYFKARERSAGTVRKDLGTLGAAIQHCHAEGYITGAPRVWLPPKAPPRDRWLTRDEAAKLIRAAYRSPRGKHLARFILMALYTGTRTSTILRLGFMPNTVGGWVDTERGVLYRRGAGEVETKKRTPPVPIPPRLLAHLRRWERQGARYVVEVGGIRVGSLKTTWGSALRDAGIEHCTKHDLRRTCATWLMQSGAPLWDAAGYLGMSVNILQSTYGHHHPDHMKGAVEAMGRRADQALSPHAVGR